MSNTHEYDAILAALEAKKDAINQAIAVIRDLMGNGNPMPSRGPMPICADQKRPAQTVQPVQGRPFHGMGTMEATLAFLRSARRPQKAGEIVKALREGGVNTTSKNFYNNVF